MNQKGRKKISKMNEQKQKRLTTTFNFSFTTITKDDNMKTVAIEEKERNDWDLNYLTYRRVERAVLLIQQSFRNSRRESETCDKTRNDLELPVDTTESSEDSEGEEQDQTNSQDEYFFTLLILTFVGLSTTVMSIIPKFFSFIYRCCGRGDNSAPNQINATTESSKGVSSR